MSASMMEEWMCSEMKKLGLEITNESARYILSMDTARDLEDYMLELLDGSDIEVQRFVKELLHRWRKSYAPVPDNVQVYRKPSEKEVVYFKGVEKTKKKLKEESHSKLWSDEPAYGDIPSDEDDDFNLPTNKYLHSDPRKRKTKFVPLYSQEGVAKDVVKLPGRHTCECQASKHKLVNNCLKCGRVICDQEGSGPCVFCGTLVCTVEEEDILAKGSRKSDKLRQHLMKGATIVPLLSSDKGSPVSTSAEMKQCLDKAVQHKDKLLEYDKTSVRRTKVYDDEADYFAAESNQWLSTEEKNLLSKREAELRKERFASRRERKITFDFAGRQILDDDSLAGSNMYDVNDDVIQQVYYTARPSDSSPMSHAGTASDIVNPNIVQAAPLYVTPEKPLRVRMHCWEMPPIPADSVRPTGTIPRIQDRQLLEMMDEGMCMSMHQPWASLLIKGIKIHEGRTWYTTHRGRLWIAATKQAPESELISKVQHICRYLSKEPNMTFPHHYPVGCLLGCVYVIDCLPQDDYRIQFPDGESGSPYVFICQQPQELTVKFPIQGKLKIYKLDSHIHQAAKKGLRQPSEL